MKLSHVLLKERIPDLGSSNFKPPIHSLDYESGIVTIQRVDRPDEEPFLVPVSNVVFMRSEPPPKKK